MGGSFQTTVLDSGPLLPGCQHCEMNPALNSDTHKFKFRPSPSSCNLDWFDFNRCQSPINRMRTIHMHHVSGPQLFGGISGAPLQGEASKMNMNKNNEARLPFLVLNLEQIS